LCQGFLPTSVRSLSSMLDFTGSAHHSATSLKCFKRLVTVTYFIIFQQFGLSVS
jgi:hypothetical protein